MKTIGLIALLAAPAHAWEPVAHKAAAIIAQKRLSPAALQAVRSILGKDSSGRELDLADVAGCADGFAHDPGFRCAASFELEGVPAASIPWHFINIPISAKDPKPADYCPTAGCVWSKIADEESVLRDPTASMRNKQSALSFIVHFIGDLHQPLHCADDGDLGGQKKLVNVELKGKKISLHKVWDEALMEPAKVDWQLPAESLAVRAKDLASELELDLRSQNPKKVAEWTNGEFVSGAAIESWRIARDDIYPDYRKDQGAIANSGHDSIGDEYHKRMQPIAYRRLEMAGVRLAYLLNRALGK